MYNKDVPPFVHHGHVDVVQKHGHVFRPWWPKHFAPPLVQFVFNRFLKRAAGRGVGKGDFFHHFTVHVQGIKKHQGRHGLGCAGAPHLKTNKIEKRLVLILLVIVFKHKIKIKKYMFVYIHQSTLYEHVFSSCGRYWKLHNEYNQHVS